MESLAKSYETFLKDWVEKFPNVSLNLVQKIGKNRVLYPKTADPFSLTIQYGEETDLKAKQSKLEENGIEVKFPDPHFHKIVTKEIPVDYALLDKLFEDKDVKFIDETCIILASK